MEITLADVTGRAETLIAEQAADIERMLEGLTAEDPEVVALFDPEDAEGMQILRELGIDVQGVVDHVAFLLRIRQAELEAAYRRHRYVPIDELPGYEPGTVLLFVFTMKVVVARRYQQRPAGSPPGLREVRRTRDVEIRGAGVSLEGYAAIEFIFQKCSLVLQGLWDGGSDRVALIDSASHGAKVGFIERDVAVDALRSKAPGASAKDRAACLGMADAIAAGPKAGMITCLMQGWGVVGVHYIKMTSTTVAARQEYATPDVDRLHEYIVACREKKRALGLLEKSLDRIGSSPSSVAAVAELLAMMRHEWQDCAAILAKIPSVVDALLPVFETPEGARLRTILTALFQATTERRRGGAINARGGSG